MAGLLAGYWLASPVLIAIGYAGFVGMVPAMFLWRPRRTLAIDSENLLLNDRRALARARVSSAVAYEDARGRFRVTIASREWWSGLLLLETPDLESAHAVVRALELPREDFFRTRIVDVSWFVAAALAMSLALFPLVFAGVMPTTRVLFFGSVLPTLGLIVSRKALIGVEYTVGKDGLRIRRLFRERFFPFARVERVVRVENGVHLYVGEKRPVIVQGMQYERVVELHMRILDALEHYRLHAIAGPTPSDLERRNRSTQEWLTSLRSIGSSSTTKYRVAATSPDDLARVLTDQSADVASRAAAAVALDAIDQNAALRIREVASHTANPELRVALERVADHAPDAEIEESLDALSETKSR